MINHLLGHTTVYADVLARNEAGLIAAKEQHHIGDIHRVPHPTDRLLRGIWTIINGVINSKIQAICSKLF